MKIVFSFLVVFLIGAACRAEETTQKPLEEAKDDLQASNTFGIGFYAGGYPFYGYGYPYGGYYGYPFKKFYKLGYPYYPSYYATGAYPALPVWG